MKKVLSLAIATALVAPVAAMADSTVYGKVRVSIDGGNEEITDTVDATNNVDRDYWEMNDRVSRLGIKGSEDLGNGLKGIYKMEFGVKVGDEFSGLSGRNAYVGLAGGFGTALVGRHDTPVKMSTGKLDLFADTVADYDVNIVSDLRADGVLAYISPNWGGFTFAAANLTHPAGTKDFSDAFSIAGMYSNGPWYASLGYETHQTSEDENIGMSVSKFYFDKNGAGNKDQTRIGLGMLDLAGFSATFVYEMRKGIGMQDGSVNAANNTDGVDSDAWALEGAYAFNPQHKIKAMYGNNKAEDQDNTAIEGKLDQYALGYQFNFSKRTDLQVIYNDVTTEIETSGTVTEEIKENVVSFQVNHSF